MSAANEIGLVKFITMPSDGMRKTAKIPRNQERPRNTYWLIKQMHKLNDILQN